ncbi:metal-dependent hydrolase [Heyndrickxia oleronia]|uniref:metal-dependent hydrolase n=1 Tax=Heyndrickxia oleronia TaxID=38875 RepID=UPI001B1AB36F|nr:metal-dependent hydrolase [Heyndrickxia oleronia]GIN41407.1 membrane protein [Heyndrickxia oleronia]
MKAKTHQLFGGTFGLVAIFLSNISELTPKNVIESLLFFACVLIGSILPDIDHYKSKAGRSVPVISHVIYFLFGHKTITHTLLFALIVSGLFGIFSFVMDCSLYYPLGLFIGLISHLIGDMFVVGNRRHGGVPLSYPLYKKKIKFPITIKIESITESILGLCLLLINVSIVFLFFKKYF